MTAGQLLFTATFGTGAALAVALVLGIMNWRSTGGKIAAFVSGVLLASLVIVVVFVILMAIFLPAALGPP